MTFVYKSHCRHCVVCIRAKPDRRGGAAFQPLGIPEYPCDFFWIEYVTDLPKRGTNAYTTVFNMVCHLTKWIPLFHVKSRSLQRSQHIHLSVIVTDNMVSLQLLFLIEILSLLGSFGRALWESWELKFLPE